MYIVKKKKKKGIHLIGGSAVIASSEYDCPNLTPNRNDKFLTQKPFRELIESVKYRRR